MGTHPDATNQQRGQMGDQTGNAGGNNGGTVSQQEMTAAMNILYNQNQELAAGMQHLAAGQQQQQATAGESGGTTTTVPVVDLSQLTEEQVN